MPVRPLRNPHGREVPWPSWKRFTKTHSLRARLAKEVNDDSWRADLKPVHSHPRRQKRGQSKPR